MICCTVAALEERIGALLFPLSVLCKHCGQRSNTEKEKWRGREEGPRGRGAERNRGIIEEREREREGG